MTLMHRIICAIRGHRWKMTWYGLPTSDPLHPMPSGSVIWSASGGSSLYVPTTWACRRCGAEKHTKERWD